MKLLFCDSFFQDPPDGSVCSSWCMIDFPVPVVLEQITVVPRGACLNEQMRSDGVVGKTSPDRFRIDFFASDEKNQKASTFDNLCALEYNDMGVHTVYPKLPFVTTKLVACGRYQVVTLAIFGAEATDSNAIRQIHQRRSEATSVNSGLLPTPSDFFHKNVDLVQPPYSNQSSVAVSSAYQSYHASLNKSVSTYAYDNDYQTANFDKRDYTNRVRENVKESFHDKSPLLPTPPMGNNDHFSTQENSKRYQYSGNYYHQHDRDNHFQTSNTHWPRDNYRNYADENSCTSENDDKKNENYSSKQQDDEDSWEDAEYEEISDEELDEETAANVEAMVAEDMLLPSSMMSYNPFHMEPYPLSHFNSPDITEFEATLNKLHNQDENEAGVHETVKNLKSEKENPSKKLKKLFEDAMNLCLVKTDDNSNNTDKKLPIIVNGKESDFITILENMVPLIVEGLPSLVVKSNSSYGFVICKWAVFTLLLDSQISQIIGLNVRALKAGLGLAQKLCQTSPDIVEHFSTLDLAEKLLQILFANYIASSVKLSTIHVLDSLTDWPLQMYEFMYGCDDFPSKSLKINNQATGYTNIIKLCLQSQTARVASALNQIVRKVHIYECMHEIHCLTQSIVLDKIPDEYSYVSDDEDHNEEDEEVEYGNHDDVEIISSASPSGGMNDEEVSLVQIGTNVDNAVNLVKKKKFNDFNLNVATQDVSVDEEILIESLSEDAESLVPMESVFPLSDVILKDEDVLKLSECLREITFAFSQPQQTIGQCSLKIFPLSQKHIAFSDHDDNCKAIRTLYRMSDESGLISSVQALLSLPFVSGYKQLFKSSYLFLNQLMMTKSGLLHLLSNSDSVLHIIHHLLKSSSRLDVETPCTAGYLGIKLAIHLQTIQSLDHIYSLLDSSSDQEEIEEDLVHDLKTLFSLTYTTFGKKFICKVLGIDSLIKPIISCLWFPNKLSDPDPKIDPSKEEDKKSTSQDDKSDDEEDTDDKKDKPGTIQHRNAVNGYASAILYFMLELSEDVSYIYRHMTDLSRACLSECHVTPRSEDYKKYLGPLGNQLNSSNNDIGKLVNFIKDKATLLEWSSLSIDGPGITTALRMLCCLCLKGPDNDERSDAESRLRVLELFAVDCLNVLLTLGEQLHKTLHYFCHGIRPMAAGLMSSIHSLITSMCRCMFSLFQFMIYHVLGSKVEDKNINKVQIAQVTVNLYSDLYILLRPTDTSLLHNITEMVIKVLSLFFAGPLPPSEERSPIIDAMIKHAESQCDNFLPTLLLLSQLLPMPLPIVTPKDPPGDARATALASCKKWSTIISPHVDDLLSFFLPLSSSISRPLVEVVLILVQQIVDLSPSLALVVVRKYIDDTSPLMVNPALANKNGDGETKDEAESEQKELLMLSSEQITAIVTFSEILTLPTAKVAAINAISTDGEGVMDLWTYAVQPHTPNEDIAAALLLASVLIDTSLFLQPLDGSAASLANVFPPTAHLNAIIDLVLQKITSSSPLIVSRVYLLLTLLQSNKLTLPHVRKILTNDDKPLYCALDKMADILDLFDPAWVEALRGCVEFLLHLTDPNLNVGVKKKEPLLSLTFGQLRGLLRWENSCEHPLRVIQKKLKTYLDNEDRPDVDYVLDQTSSLIQSLNAAKNKEKIPPLSLVELPVAVPLTDQFEKRPVFVIGDSDPILETRLSITAPFPTPSDAPEAEDERMVKCDLIATASEFCPGFDLADELGKLAKAVDVQHVAEETEAMEKRRQKMETYSARIGKSLTFIKRSHGLLIAQQRTNRGRGRGTNPSNRPYDLFRHRKQNTSRPPSMHVDDFVAADEEQMKMEGEDTSFKSPPPPTVQLRRPSNQTFKQQREFISRGGRGGRISRSSNSNSYRGRSSFSYQRGNSSVTPLNKFRPRPSSTGSSRGGRSHNRFRVISPRLNSRLSFSPHEGFKTNKQDQGSWNASSRDYSSPYRGRGGRISKPGRGNFHGFQNKFGSSFSRRARGFKYRGKHIRSTTR